MQLTVSLAKRYRRLNSANADIIAGANPSAMAALAIAADDYQDFPIPRSRLSYASAVLALGSSNNVLLPYAGGVVQNGLYALSVSGSPSITISNVRHSLNLSLRPTAAPTVRTVPVSLTSMPLNAAPFSTQSDGYTAVSPTGRSVLVKNLIPYVTPSQSVSNFASGQVIADYVVNDLVEIPVMPFGTSYSSIETISGSTPYDIYYRTMGTSFNDVDWSSLAGLGAMDASAVFRSDITMNIEDNVFQNAASAGTKIMLVYPAIGAWPSATPQVGGNYFPSLSTPIPSPSDFSYTIFDITNLSAVGTLVATFHANAANYNIAGAVLSSVELSSAMAVQIGSSPVNSISL